MSINRVIAALGVVKSSVYYKARQYPERKRTLRKQLPEQVKQSIEKITSLRATYGTPRVRAILKRDYGVSVSKYMIHRYMKEEGLLLKRFRTRGASRPHTGKISVEQPNARWASDITSIKCWNGQKLRVALVMDCCDRSIISWKAGLTMQACHIELLVQEAIFQRFADGLPPKDQLQLLHDNGPEYIEKNFQKRLKEWNINDCHTPTYSPQSNGMCEALNGTLKRDYVFESCLDDPKTVIDQIQGWVDDYNNFAPHSALKMKTPKEYFIFKLAA